MKKTLYIFAFIIFGVNYNCTNTSLEDLQDSTPLPTTVTYNANISPVIQNNCITCHSAPPTNGATIPLVNYQNVVNAVQNNNLIGRISLQSGASGAMPLGGQRLPQNIIDIFIQWEAEGLLEN